MKIYSYVTFFILLFPFTINAQSIDLQRDPSDPNRVYYDTNPDTGEQVPFQDHVDVTGRAEPIKHLPIEISGTVPIPEDSPPIENVPRNEYGREFGGREVNTVTNPSQQERSVANQGGTAGALGQGVPACIGEPNCPANSPQQNGGTARWGIGVNAALGAQAKCKVWSGADCNGDQMREFMDMCKNDPEFCEGIPFQPGGDDQSSAGTGEDGGGPESDPGLAEAAGQCESAASRAEGRCSVFDNIMMAGMLAPIMSGVGSGGSGKRACETAQALSAAGLVTNLTFARRCSSAAGTCITSCENAISNSQEAGHTRLYSLRAAKGKCEGLKSKTAWVWMSAAQNVQSILASRDCIKHFENAERIARCRTLSEEEFKGDTFCQREYCNRLPFNIRLHDPLCKDGVSDIDCSIKHNFGKLACVCERNPQDPACGMPNADPSQPVAAPNPYDQITGDPYGNGDMPFQPEDFLDPVEDPQAAPGGTVFGGPSAPGGGAGGGYGTGLGGGSSGSYSAGSTGRGKGNSRRGKSGSDKSIISGSSSGRSSGGGRYGGRYRPNFQGKGYAGKRSAPFDLKKLLPGAKTRGLAGASKKKMEKAGISSANGLTNWEKVRIRYMEQRRRNSFINKP